MKTYNKEIEVYCDVQADWRCFGESSYVLHWWEGKLIAYKHFKCEGWFIGHSQDICPYCLKEEFRKCKESPAYFYNNYVLIDGEKPKRKITDKEIKDMESFIKEMRQRRKI